MMLHVLVGAGIAVLGLARGLWWPLAVGIGVAWAAVLAGAALTHRLELHEGRLLVQRWWIRRSVRLDRLTGAEFVRTGRFRHVELTDDAGTRVCVDVDELLAAPPLFAAVRAAIEAVPAPRAGPAR